MGIVRYYDWPRRLSEYIAQDVKFIRGYSDCVIYVTDAVRAITGHDMAKKWRGTYNTYEEAMAIIATEFQGNILNPFIDTFGKPHENIFMARRGDVVYCRTNDGHTLGFVDDSGYRVVFMSENIGKSYLGIASITKVWAVG